MSTKPSVLGFQRYSFQVVLGGSNIWQLSNHTTDFGMAHKIHAEVNTIPDLGPVQVGCSCNEFNAKLFVNGSGWLQNACDSRGFRKHPMRLHMALLYGFGVPERTLPLQKPDLFR